MRSEHAGRGRTASAESAMAGRGRTVTAEVAALLMAFCRLCWHCGDGVRALSRPSGESAARAPPPAAAARAGCMIHLNPAETFRTLRSISIQWYYTYSFVIHSLRVSSAELRQGDSFSQSFWTACNTTHSHSHFGPPATPLILIQS